VIPNFAIAFKGQKEIGRWRSAPVRCYASGIEFKELKINWERAAVVSVCGTPCPSRMPYPFLM
jgi:hypothetical protein